ncbi:MAG: LemA family protein [bacterium]|nr:LemA family protein [Candidatus Sumerlaeota bacterium]
MILGVVILVIAVVVLILYAVGTYNGLVRMRNEVQNAWSQIDVQLKRRYDLIPNLVETVKGYAAHERQTLENVTKARNMAMSATGVPERAEAENVLTGALKSLFAVSEAYPDLKANQNFLQLQEELTSTENKIAFSRQYYNDSTMNYNTRIEQFPANIVAGMFNFTRREFFEAKEPAEREAVKVKF